MTPDWPTAGGSVADKSSTGPAASTTTAADRAGGACGAGSATSSMTGPSTVGRRGIEWRRCVAVECSVVERLCGVGRGRREVAGCGGRQPGAAHRPRAAALPGQHPLCDRDLLFPGGHVGGRGELAAAGGPPGARRELQPALIAVAGVDRPVVAGFAMGHLVPFAIGGRCRLGAHGQAAASDDRAGEGDFRDVDTRLGGLAMPSTHAPDLSSLYAPARSAVGFGQERPPGRFRTRVDATPASPQGTASGSWSDIGGPVGPPPPSTVSSLSFPHGWRSARKERRANRIGGGLACGRP